jgi:hypothetical protein
MHLPLDYPRINQFPEWFTTQPKARYRVTVDGQRQPDQTGDQLARGLPVSLKAGKSVLLEVRNR